MLESTQGKKKRFTFRRAANQDDELEKDTTPSTRQPRQEKILNYELRAPRTFSKVLFRLQKPPPWIVNGVGLYRNPRIPKMDEISMWDCCKIENHLRSDVGEAEISNFRSE